MYKYHRELAEVNDSLAKCFAGIGSFYCFLSEMTFGVRYLQSLDTCISETICYKLFFFVFFFAFLYLWLSVR